LLQVGRRPPDQKYQRSIKRETGRTEVTEQASQRLHNKVELGVLSDKEESFANQPLESKAMSSKTMIQALDLKENLENQGITCNNSMTASTDAEDFYPSVRLKLTRKAVCHFSKELSEEDQITIKHCPNLIKFGMQPNLLAFVDKSYECDSDIDPEEKGAHHWWI